jgi:hypothetical protein
MEGDGATLLAGVGILGCRYARSAIVSWRTSFVNMTVQDILAAYGSIRGGGPPRGILEAIAVVSRSGDSNPAEGGGDGGDGTETTAKFC